DLRAGDAVTPVDARRLELPGLGVAEPLPERLALRRGARGVLVDVGAGDRRDHTGLLVLDHGGRLRDLRALVVPHPEVGGEDHLPALAVVDGPRNLEVDGRSLGFSR